MQDSEKNSKESVEFLKKFHEHASCVLAAIDPTGKVNLIAKKFDFSKTEEVMRAQKWIEHWNGRRNLYFQVNPMINPSSKKAKKEDIQELAWLHVDIDPRVNEDLEDERKRCLRILTKKLPNNIPPPTVIIFSGGGYQAFWRLVEPVPINGDLGLAEEVAAYNRQLEMVFQADNCHNIDRIMRLPGTVNIPDSKKRKKGRKRELARVVEFNENVYDIKSFVAAAKIDIAETKDFSSGSNSMVKVRSGNIKRLEDITELDEWRVPDRVKVIAVQGEHPDEKPRLGKDSRSEWLFDFVCCLVRCEVPDEIIYGILLDYKWRISASVLDKPTPEKYATRQIQRAKDVAIDPQFAMMNEKHFIIENYGGKCVVGEFIPVERSLYEKLSVQSFTDFKNRYSNKYVQVGVTEKGAPIIKTLPKFWLEHARRRSYKQVIFAPGKDKEINDCLNLWQGFSVVPKEGDCTLILEYIHEVLACNDKVCSDYIIKWMAWAVQNPEKTAEVALVFKGGQGTGKSTFGRMMAALFGVHGLQISSPGHLVGHFNAHLQTVCLLFADEAVRAEDKSARGTLKALLTEQTLAIEAKGKDVITSPNCVKIIMASNNQFVVPVEQDDRRFAVFKVSDKYKQSTDYFKKLNKYLEGDGLKNLFHYLLDVSLNDWHPRFDIPVTEERLEQKSATYTGIESIILDFLKSGEIPDSVAVQHYGNDKLFLTTASLQNYAQAKLRKDVTLSAIGRFLFKKLELMKDRKNSRRGCILPSLPQARKIWDDTMGCMTWDNEINDWSYCEHDFNHNLNNLPY